MDSELPTGFAMALAMNETAMKNFAALSKEERDAVVQQTRGVSSRQEMRRLVDHLATWKWQRFYG